MGMFDRLKSLVIRKENGSLSPVDSRGGGGWFSMFSNVREPFPGAWQQNIEWTNDSALRYYAMYACITQIANDIGKLRYILKEKDPQSGIWTEVDDRTSPSFQPVLLKPNDYQNHIQFKEWWIMSKLQRGNTYVLKQRDARGIVTGLVILDPLRTSPMVSDTGEVFYRCSPDNLTGVTNSDVAIPASEIIHDRMNCLFHPLVGISPIFASGLAATQGTKIQEDSVNFYRNAAMPGGILTTPTPISSDIAARYKEAWDNNYSGTNSGKVAVLGNGLTFIPTRMTAVDAQTFEQLKLSAEMVCSTFKVPSFIVGVGPVPPGFVNVQALWSMYYVQCLQTYIESMEQLLNDGLGLDTPKGNRMLGVELDLTALLRMDTGAKTTAVGDAIKAGFMTANEGRAQFDLQPVKGGDTIFLQQQNFPIQELAARKPPTDSLDPKPAPAPAPAVDPNAPADPPAPDDPPSGDNAASKAFIPEVQRLMRELVDARRLETAD